MESDTATPESPVDAPAETTPDRPLWRDHDHVAWLAADTSWQFGASIRAFAMLLIAYSVTGSYAQAGLLSTVSTIAEAVTTLPGGVLVDRWDRRLSLTVSGTTRFLVYGGAALAWWNGTLTIGVLYAVGIASGIIGGLFATAASAALKSVVATRDLPRAVAVNQGRNAAVDLSAAPIAGALMGISTALPFAATALGAVLQVIGTWAIRTDLHPDPHPSGGERTQRRGGSGDPDRPSGNNGRARPGLPALRGLLAGFTIYRDIPVLLRMLPAVVLVNSGMVALYTGIQLILQGQGVQPWRIGLLDTAVGVGMLAGSFVAPHLIRRIPTGRLSVTLFAACALVLMPLAFSQRVPLVLTILTIVGLMLPALNGAMGGYFQSRIPGHLQGRAMSTMRLVQDSVPSLMPALVGFGLQGIGAGPTMLAVSVLFPAAAVLILTHRELRSLPVPSKWDLTSDGAGAATVGG